jgi:hypothetical protein
LSGCSTLSDNCDAFNRVHSKKRFDALLRDFGASTLITIGRNNIQYFLFFLVALSDVPSISDIT